MEVTTTSLFFLQEEKKLTQRNNCNENRKGEREPLYDYFPYAVLV
jgi:hypothetical protein